MTSVNAVGSNAPKFMTTTNQETVTTYGQANSSDPINFSSAPANQMQVDNSGDLLSSKCTDGNDDGKVGFAKGAVAIGKGAVKSVGNMLEQLNPLKHPFKFLGAVAMAAVCVLVPPVGVAVAVVGGATAAVSLASNAAQVLTDTEGKTDEEQIALLENCGADGLQVGLSIVGAKAGLKAMSATEGSAMAGLKAAKAAGEKVGIVDKATAFGKDAISGGRGFENGHINTANAGYKGTQIYTHVKGNIKDHGAIDGLKQTGKDAFNNTKIGQKYADTAKTKTVDKDGVATEQNRTFGERYQEARQNVKTDKITRKVAAKARAQEASAQKKYDSLFEKNEAGQMVQKESVTQAQLDAAKKALDDARLETIKIERNAVKESIKPETAKIEQKGNEIKATKEQMKGLQEGTPEYKALNEKLTTQKAELNELNHQSGRAASEAHNKLDSEIENVKTSKQKVQTKQDTLKTAQDKLDELKKAESTTPEQLKAQRAEIAKAKAELSQVQSDYNATYGGAIKSNAAKYDAFAKSAGYTSGFGSLTAPAAGALAAENPSYETQNLQTAVINSEATQAYSSSSGWVTPQLQQYSLSDHDAQLALLNQQLNSVAM